MSGCRVAGFGFFALPEKGTAWMLHRNIQGNPTAATLGYLGNINRLHRNDSEWNGSRHRTQ